MRVVASLLLLVATALAALVGIDYGHEFTKAVLLAPGFSFEVLLTDEAKRKDVSGLCIRSHNNQDLERVYGSAARGLFTRFPQSCVANIKPLLGKASDDPVVAHYLNTHPGVKIIGQESRSNNIKFDFGFKNQSYAFSTEELLAMNFEELKTRALQTLRENPKAHVIAEDVIAAIPPFADQLARQAYIDSLELASFSNVLGLVDEGTAVAINFVSSKKLDASELGNEKAYYMVYDMGAGSTKATLFSVRSSLKQPIILELENVGFDQTFGGEALTFSLYSILAEKLATSLNTDENAQLPPRTAARLFEAAEKAKNILSANTEYHVSLESIVNDEDFKATLTREEFEQINIDSMQRINKPILDALSGTGLSVKDLKAVILAGGSTRVPFVQKHLSVFLGEEKISKTVNADESCAMGTTARGFELMSALTTTKDLKVIEKAFHNFELSVNQSDTQSVIFPRGQVVGNTTRVPIGDLSDEFSLELLEDGKLIKSYEFKDVLQKTSYVTCNDDPKYTKKLFANVTLDANKLFKLDRVEVECVKPAEKKGLFKKILGSKEDDIEAEEEEEDVQVEEEEEVPEVEADADETDADKENESADNSSETETKTTSKPRKSRRLLKPVSIGLPKPLYPEFEPLPKTKKGRISAKLDYLAMKDKQRIQLEQTKNELEASCYELRNLIEDNEDKVSEEVPVDQYTSKVAEIIEWLEFDSDEASVEDFEDNINQISELKSEVNKAIKMADTDLSFEQVSKINKESASIAAKLQSKLMELGNEVAAIRQKYEKESFDFDKENERVRQQLYSRGDDKLSELEKSMMDYQEKMTAISKIVESEEVFNMVGKKEVFEKYEEVADSIVNILADLLTIDSVHKQRLELLNSRYTKLIERRAQKELKEKIKQEKAKSRKTESTVSADKDAEKSEDSEPIESDPVYDKVKQEETEKEKEEQEELKQDDPQEEETNEKETEEEIEHDEL